MTVLVVIAVFMARNLSGSLLENGYDMSYENNIREETVSVGAFGEENKSDSVELRKDRLPYFKEVIDLIRDGAVPLIMYLLSVLCLVDLIKSTYTKFNDENDLVDKTLYILFIIGQMAMIGLISYYVVTISFEVLIIWLLVALLLTVALYLGPSLIHTRRKFRR